MNPTVFATVYAFLVGLCIGSFLNVCISRWPQELSVVRPRSRCPKCAHEIAWFENIPVLSWIALRARCRSCGEPISIIYPLGELSVGVIWAASVLYLGPNFTAVRLAVFLSILFGIAVTDMRHYLIPDGFTVTGLLWTLATAFTAVFIGEVPLFAGPYDSLLGACAGAGLIAIVGWLGEVALKKEAMGMGDMTLMAFVGAAVGPENAMITVFVGATIGAVVFLGVVYPVVFFRRRSTPAPHDERTPGADSASAMELPLVPFGVFLAPAAAIMLIWGDMIRSRLF